MTRVCELAKRYPATIFVIFAYALTWLAWGVLLWRFGRTPIETLIEQPLAVLLIYLGGASPTIAAFALTGLIEGRAGLAALWARVTRRKASVTAWAAALALPYLLAWSAVFVSTTTAPSMPASLGAVVVSTLPLLLVGPLCEETGWRGFLQPRLFATHHPLVAVLLLGTIWTFWHVPLSLTPGTTGDLSTPLAWAVYWLGTIATATVIAALTRPFGDSVLVAMLFHWGSNAALSQVVLSFYPAFDPATDARIATVQLFLTVGAAMAAYILVLAPRADRAEPA